MKLRTLFALSFLLATPGVAQKKPEKPKVHADFYFGSLPAMRELADLMSKEQARIVLVGYHNGWSVEKMAKELKITESQLTKVADDLDQQKLAGEVNEYDVRPLLPVIREKDIDRLLPDLQKHTQEFAGVLESTLPDIEKFVLALPQGDGSAKDRLMYETVVSGLLFGGIVDALEEDKTILPPGRRRTPKGIRAYAWLVESDPALAGKYKRDVRESDNYQIISIGPDFPKTRASLDELRSSKLDVFDDPVARQYRTFIAVLCRDKFLPYFKTHRSEFLKLAAIPESSKYVAAAEFFGWYYDAIASGVTDQLIASGKLKPPSDVYTYAIKNPAR